MLRKELLDYNFYRRSLSLFMKNSPGIREQIDTWTGILNNVDTCAENIVSLFDIFYYKSSTDNYLTKHNFDASNTKLNFLDKLCEIYGISRTIVLTEIYNQNKEELPPESQKLIQITLNDKELLLLLEATVKKYNFNGTREGLREIYQGAPIFKYDKYLEITNPEITAYLKHIKTESFLTKLGIMYIDNSTAPAACVIALTGDIKTLSVNIINLFLNGFLTIESMGIMYTYALNSLFTDATFDTAGFYSPSQTKYYVFAGSAKQEEVTV
uniref:Uncharacterized protein n=1 Tax=Myoviridae sp. ctj3P51 TaxID=2826687 RepID=A0A8S5NQ06_9CAUD|nr:MAG TPA: hypothetical protein [Myoviridae sp. ctj3P51]